MFEPSKRLVPTLSRDGVARGLYGLTAGTNDGEDQYHGYG